MAKLEVHQFPCLSDNYGFLAHAPETGATACIDTPEAEPILAALAKTGWKLTHILNTHWHPDHTGANATLVKETGCEVIGPVGEKDNIPGIGRAVGQGDEVDLGGHVARVFDVPGHTAGHIAYWFADDSVAFVGDTLFALGCGRLFEGTAEQMWNSLGKLMALPADTMVYCAHEYTQANARFALTVDPDNPDLVARAKEIDRLRADGHPTVPTTIGLELKTNPFLRAEAQSLQRTIGMEGKDPVAVFAETRLRKDNF